jgi:hypothetical protein
MALRKVRHITVPTVPKTMSFSASPVQIYAASKISVFGAYPEALAKIAV